MARYSRIDLDDRITPDDYNYWGTVTTTCISFQMIPVKNYFTNMLSCIKIQKIFSVIRYSHNDLCLRRARFPQYLSLIRIIE
jgi:hypothetical protein